MSVDPDSAAPQDQNFPPTVRERMPIPPAKRRHKRENEDESTGGAEVSLPPDADPLTEEIEALNARVRSLTTRLNTARREPAPQVPQETRTVKYHRLERKQTAPGAPRDPTSPASSADAAVPITGAAPVSDTLPTTTEASTPAPAPAGPVVLPPQSTIHYAPWHGDTWHPGWLLASAGIITLGLLTFFLGRYSNQPVVIKEIVPVVAPVWTAQDTQQLDAIIAADRLGKVDDAYHQAKLLNEQLGSRLGLSLYTCFLQARNGALNNAEADLTREVNRYAPPLVTAAVQDHLGFIYARRRDFAAARNCFAAAAAANPFDPMAFYHWGEAQRRTGQLADAILKFQQVLLRLPSEDPETESLRECTALRLRLCQIELGADAEVKAGIDRQLGQAVPSVYWLLTAVAYDIQHNDPAAAVAAVERAKILAPPAEFDLLCNDYYLRGLARGATGMAVLAPELTRARRARLDASLVYFIDP